MMRPEIRATALYRQIVEFCGHVRRPGTGQVSDAAQLRAAADGQHVVFAGTIAESATEEPPMRIALTDLATGATRLLTSGPNTDKAPRFCADGDRIAFLSDRCRTHDFQLHLLDRASGDVRAPPRVDGRVEYLQWSPDGTKILLGVVGPSGTQSDRGERTPAEELPTWLPSVEPTDAHDHWRSCWVFDLASNTVRRVPTKDCNIWDACWHGNTALAAVTSQRPDEGSWYSASLAIVHLETGAHADIYVPLESIGRASCIAHRSERCGRRSTLQ